MLQDYINQDDSYEKVTEGLDSFHLLDSDMYKVRIKYGYLNQSEAGSLSLNLCVSLLDHDNREVNLPGLLLTGTNKKGNKNHYVKNDKKYLFNTYVLADNISMLTTGKSIVKLPTEKKIIKKYNYDDKKEVPTEVDMFPDLENQEIYMCIMHVETNKQRRREDGTYATLSETKFLNRPEHVCSVDTGKTQIETAESLEAEFGAKWVKKWKGKIKKEIKPASEEEEKPLAPSSDNTDIFQ